MSITCWQAAVDGRYWMGVAVGSIDLSVMVDLGMVDPLHRIGFEVEPSIYDHLQKTGQLTSFQRRSRRDSSGHSVPTESGSTTAQLLDPLSKKRIGPLVSLFVSRGTSGVPSRVGVVFFHSLIGCKVLWDLTSQSWCVDY